MKIAVVLTQSPFSGSFSRESLDLILALAAVEHQISLVFMQDAVYQLLQAEDSAPLLVKDFRRSFKLFELYDIEQVVVCAASLQQRMLSASALRLDAEVLDVSEINALLDAQHHVIRA